jgi:uncharacterized membrane protein
MMSGGFATFAMSIAMVAAFMLAFFGIRLVATGQDRGRGAQKGGAALVMV